MKQLIIKNMIFLKLLEINIKNVNLILDYVGGDYISKNINLLDTEAH